MAALTSFTFPNFSTCSTWSSEVPVHGLSVDCFDGLLPCLFQPPVFIPSCSELQRNPAGTEQTRLTTDWLMSRSTDWLMPPSVMKWWLMFSMSLRNLNSTQPSQDWPFQRSTMLTTSCGGWATEWWMSVDCSRLGGQLQKGPHLKRQLHNAGESHRYALSWPRSAVSSQLVRAEIK